MHSQSDNIEIMVYNESDKVIQEHFESLLTRYPTRLDKCIKGSEFIIDCVNLLHYKCHNTNLKRDGSYIASPTLI